jgi:hypothetical protein
LGGIVVMSGYPTRTEVVEDADVMYIMTCKPVKVSIILMGMSG